MYKFTKMENANVSISLKMYSCDVLDNSQNTDVKTYIK